MEKNKRENSQRKLIILTLVTSPLIGFFYVLLFYNLIGPDKIDGIFIMEFLYLSLSLIFTIATVYLIYKTIKTTRTKNSETIKVNEQYNNKFNGREVLIKKEDILKEVTERRIQIEKEKKEQRKILEMNNINELDFKSAMSFYKRPIFKETLNPTNKNDLYTIETKEFKLLNDLGLVSQDKNYPYKFYISTDEKQIELASMFFEYKKDRPIIIPRLDNFDSLENGFDFENYIANLLGKLNYNNIEILPMSNDYGADVLAEFNNVKYAIQCKYYESRVGITAVQEIIGAKKHYNAQVAVVATNSTFTSNAINLAKSNNVVLWERSDLLEMIDQVQK